MYRYPAENLEAGISVSQGGEPQPVSAASRQNRTFARPASLRAERRGATRARAHRRGHSDASASAGPRSPSCQTMTSDSATLSMWRARLAIDAFRVLACVAS